MANLSVADELPRLSVGLPTKPHAESDIVRVQGFNKLRTFMERYWKVWGKAYGYDIDFRYAPHEELGRLAMNGDLDIVAVSAINTAYSNALFSVPYAYTGGVLYERLSDSVDAQGSALNLPSSLYPENYSHSQPSVYHGYDIQEVIRHAEKVNFIYSWGPNELAQLMAKSPVSKDFVLARETRGVPLRFKVALHRTDLMLKINEGIRSISPALVEDLWESIDVAEDVSIDLVIGDYYQNLSTDLEHELIENPTITYAYIERGEEPYFISDGFEIEGYTIDVLNAISSRIGLTFVGKPYRSFQEALDAATSGEVDIFPGVYRTDARTETLSFTKDIDKASMAIISEQEYSSIRELEGLRIALVRGLHENDLVANIIPNNPVIYLDTAEEAIKAVALGRADAFVGKLLNSIYLVDKHKFYSLKVHNALDIEDDLWPRIATAKGREGLVELLNLGIYSLGQPFQRELGNKWRRTLEENYQDVQRAQMYQQVLYLGVGLGLLFIIGMVVYRQQLVRRNKIQNSLKAALKEAEEAKSQAENMALAKSDFLARMSHEIRTPMNGVLGMAEALSFTRLDKEQTDLLNTLNGSARNLMALLNDVLDFSKMDAGKLTLESIECNLESLVNGVIGNFKHKAQAKGLTLNCRIDGHLNRVYSCDSTRLMQVLNNLVSNSVKFTEKGYVEVTAQLITKDYRVGDSCESKDLISLQVRDSGIGIPKDKLRSLFDPFVQADGDITRRFGGTGLGLSISKEIVDGMGGEIKVSSVVGHGSLFNILLPVSNVEQPAQEVVSEVGETDVNGDLSRIKVLFAEDNEVNRKVIGGQLKRLGVTFDTAENGLVAWEKYTADPSYDLILSDCHMPEMDGFTLASKVCETFPDSKPHLIAITADALSGAAKRCLAAGFDDYISKPCPIDVLETKLHGVAAGQLPSQGVQELAPQAVSIPTEPVSVDESPTDIMSGERFNDTSFEQADEDLSWLDEFESVTPQPEAEDDLSWLDDQRNAMVQEKVDSPLESLLAELEDLSEPQTASNEQELLDFLQATEPTSAPLHLPDYDAFEPTVVIEMSGGDMEIAKEILDTFIANYRNDLNEISESGVSGDNAWLKDVAHRIKGSALYLGNHAIATVAKDLEKASEANDMEHAGQRVEYIERHLQVLANEIELYCESL
ncbi:transporter substrate-binding domain-containing protein [Vibrio aquaticus]|uniref:histidine kinase n=1 Tax=Vibrio aquaticus TaxID=2496559 RepID=A0A3S0MRG6_9VIBR|nr:transporter substrate-binding domain-containing protein [Vibrio aquaticus]RTZ18311.1 transporter substrate-binding domain-containing protein [Vibrio aquaticus]